MHVLYVNDCGVVAVSCTSWYRPCSLVKQLARSVFSSSFFKFDIEYVYIKKDFSNKKLIEVREYLFQLTTPPVNTRALAILSTVAGDALTRHLSKIIPAMFQAIDKSRDSDEQDQVMLNTDFISSSEGQYVLYSKMF